MVSVVPHGFPQLFFFVSSTIHSRINVTLLTIAIFISQNFSLNYLNPGTSPSINNCVFFWMHCTKTAFSLRVNCIKKWSKIAIYQWQQDRPTIASIYLNRRMKQNILFFWNPIRMYVDIRVRKPCKTPQNKKIPCKQLLGSPQKKLWTYICPHINTTNTEKNIQTPNHQDEKKISHKRKNNDNKLARNFFFSFFRRNTSLAEALKDSACATATDVPPFWVTNAYNEKWSVGPSAVERKCCWEKI